MLITVQLICNLSFNFITLFTSVSRECHPVEQNIPFITKGWLSLLYFVRTWESWEGSIQFVGPDTKDFTLSKVTNINAQISPTLNHLRIFTKASKCKISHIYATNTTIITLLGKNTIKNKNCNLFKILNLHERTTCIHKLTKYFFNLRHKNRSKKIAEIQN